MARADRSNRETGSVLLLMVWTSESMRPEMRLFGAVPFQRVTSTSGTPSTEVSATSLNAHATRPPTSSVNKISKVEELEGVVPQPDSTPATLLVPLYVVMRRA